MGGWVTAGTHEYRRIKKTYPKAKVGQGRGIGDPPRCYS